eukprot:Blabericola_migrator_1__3342@NODE_1988_length_3452_cov_6_066470_g1266_i0_p2_GENE_NODE_1988_length_3452_cov_6_066470_g1266_i0NODE_1988_length_3452_cov_6_066470_g1266_i0_p2_ORF_typecomplete_len274_score37_50_NODE_1988_length_3452_cov_6_066470_g1266_i09221743
MPQDQRRKIDALARMRFRNAFLCRVSRGRLPYCAEDDEEPESIDMSGVKSLEGQDGVTDGNLGGFKLSGIAKSCEVQGGCQMNYNLPVSLFEGTYWAEMNENRDDLRFVQRFKSPVAGIEKATLLTDVNATLRSRTGWMFKQKAVKFKALILLQHESIEEAMTYQTPFLYLDEKNANNTDTNSSDLDTIYNRGNWDKVWLDWRISQAMLNPTSCRGLFNIEVRLCEFPVGVIIQPVTIPRSAEQREMRKITHMPLGDSIEDVDQISNPSSSNT